MKSACMLAVLTGLHFSTVFAAVNYSDAPASSNNTLTIFSTPLFAPVTPAEATFEEMNDAAVYPAINMLSPVNPAVADFNEEAPAPAVSVATLAPITPREADFEEIPEVNSTVNPAGLAPVMPVVADFEDHV